MLSITGPGGADANCRSRRAPQSLAEPHYYTKIYIYLGIFTFPVTTKAIAIYELPRIKGRRGRTI